MSDNDGSPPYKAYQIPSPETQDKQSGTDVSQLSQALPAMPMDMPSALRQMELQMAKKSNSPDIMLNQIQDDLKWEASQNPKKMYQEIMSKYYKNKDFNTNTTDPKKSLKNQIQEKVKLNRTLQPRFTEAALKIQYQQKLTDKQKTELATKAASQFYYWHRAHIVDVWASSVLIIWRRWFWFWWFLISYNPPWLIYYHWGYWASTGGHSKSDVVEFRSMFDNVRRLWHIWVCWAYSPGEYQYLYTEDNQNWKVLKDWSHTVDNPWHRWMITNYWWWRWYYQSFWMGHALDEPTTMSGFLIKMRDPVNYYFGIYKIDVYQLPWLVQIRSLANKDQCITRQSGSNDFTKKMEIYDCIDAVSINDGREIWYYDNNFLLRSQTHHGMCADNLGYDLKTMGMWSCHGGQNQQFVYKDKGKYVMVFGGYTKCLTAVSDAVAENIARRLYNHVEASSTLFDGQHDANNARNGGDSSWASQPGDIKVTWKMYFGGQAETIKEISIDWTYPALEFEIALLTVNNIWQTIVYQNSNQKKKTEFTISPQNYLGIQIVMLKNHPVQGLHDGEPIYGIKDVKIDSGAKGLQLKDCKDGDESKTNKWILEDIYWINYYVNWDILNEKSRLNQVVGNLITITNIMVQAPPQVKKVLELAAKFKLRLNTIDDSLAKYDIEFSTFKSNFDKTIVWLYPETAVKQAKGSEIIGANVKFPAKDCASIKKVYPHKYSGYYWVKTECQPSPLRVFCDFEVGNGMLYAYYGSLKEGEYFQDIHSVNRAQYHCAQLGFEPIELKTEKQIESVIKYVRDIGLKLNGEVIPLGYDYGCLSGAESCKNIYRSLNNENSNDFTDVLKSHLDKNNIANQAFSLGIGSKRDAIGMGMNDGKLQYFDISKAKIKGLICSSNKDGTEGEKFVEATCQTTLRANPDFDGHINSQFYVICPKGCQNAQNANVWGSNLYKDDSSICKAAIHAGAITNQDGGKIELSIERGIGDTEPYVGVLDNGVKSLDFNQKWDRSFVINKVVEKCPIQRFLKPSFLQLEQHTNVENTNVLNDLQNKRGLYKRRSRANLSAFIETSSDLELQDNYKYKILDNGDNNSSNSSSQNDTKGQSQEEIINEKKEIFQEGKKEQSTYSIKTTGDAIKAIQALYTHEDNYIKRQIKLMQDVHNLNNRILQQMFPVLRSDLSGYFLLKRIKISGNHYAGSSSYLKKLISDAANRLKLTYRKYQLKLLEKFKLLRWKPFQEEFHFEIQDIWDIYENPLAQNGPSSWQYTDQNLAGKVKAICQLSKINYCPKEPCQGTPTMILLKYRDWYDLKLQASLLMRDADIVGIVFGAKDPFNYYVFEMSQKRKFKRIRRVLQGNSHILNSVEDGGFLQNAWYKVILTIEKGYFKVQMGEESQGASDQALKVVIEAEDQAFSRGQYGFLTNGMSGFYISDFKVKTKRCKQPPVVTRGVVYRPPECSRYYENFFGDISLRYSIVEPNFVVNGPTKWSFQKNKFQRNKVIYQASNAFSQSPDKIPNICLLEYDQWIKDGYVVMEFLAEKEGIVGLVFRYVDQKNYYVLEIGGQKQQFIRVRKVVDGVWALIEEQQSVGYELEKWYKIQMFIEKDQFKVYFNQLSESDTPVFDPPIQDDTFREGKLGLSTYLTPAAFGYLKMHPISDLVVEQKKEEEQQQQKEYIQEESKQSQDKKDQKKYDNNNDKKLDYSKCLQNGDALSRSKACSSMFQMDKYAQQNCENNYCKICCENEIDWLHKSHRFTCTKQCSEVTSESEEDIYKACTENPNPEKSVYNYCQTQFQIQSERDQCKTDFCDLCCITSSQMSNKLVSQKSIDYCNKKCQGSFGNNQSSE